jgi:hypothetical protein
MFSIFISFVWHFLVFSRKIRALSPLSLKKSMKNGVAIVAAATEPITNPKVKPKNQHS